MSSPRGFFMELPGENVNSQLNFATLAGGHFLCMRSYITIKNYSG